MRRMVWLSAFTAALVLALPATATEKERVGTQLTLFPSAPATFSANQPFHIAHGWLVAGDWSDYDALGKRYFSLEINGELITPSFIERTSDDGVLRRIWVYNFENGLPAGTYTFNATWTSACQAALDSGLYSGTCEKPTAPVVAIGALTQTIEFAH